MKHITLAREADGQPDTTPVRGPFVVNLCASVAPIDQKAGSLPGLERYRLYQVRRVEDNRTRYRLRLGFFADEAATEGVLSAIRQYYPAAFCVPAGTDDLKHAPGFNMPVPSTNATGRQVKLPPPAPANRQAAPGVAADRVAPTSESRPAHPAPVRTSTATAVPAPESRKTDTLELLPDPAPAAPPPEAPALTAPAFPFRVRPADPAVLQQPEAQELRLETETGPAAPLLARPELTDRPILIDSTQTLRMLTECELKDEGPHWFALELALSEQAINLETMPKLDIFAAFRLYSVATPQQGQIRYSLRLGFFRERVSAEAVAGYLKTFFSSPEVIRVSNAEQARFAEPPKPPVLTEAAQVTAKVVPLNEARVKAGKPMQPTPPHPTPVARPSSPTARAPAATPVAKPAPAVKKPPGKRAAVRNRPLNELLHEEAREVALSESGIRRMEQKGSLLSRLVGRFAR